MGAQDLLREDQRPMVADRFLCVFFSVHDTYREPEKLYYKI
jgi:hypothetical protein